WYPIKTYSKREMKKSILTMIVAAFAVVHTASAVTIQSVQVDVSGFPGDITFDEGGYSSPGPYSAPTPVAGLNLAYDGAVILQSSSNANGAQPFPHETGNYLSVMANGTATFSFSDLTSRSFGF